MYSLYSVYRNSITRAYSLIFHISKSYQDRKLKLGAFVHHKITRMLLKNQVPGINYNRVMPREDERKFKKNFNFFSLLSSVFPKTHKSTFKTYYFTFSHRTSNFLQFDIYFVRVIFQTHIVMCS